MNEIITGQDIVPMDLMQRAITSGSDVGVLEKLMELHHRAEDNRARRAYAAAMADAKAEFPIIKKDRKVEYTTNRGKTSYMFADMATIAEAIDKPLSKHGLTYRFRTVTSAPAVVTVTCIISHRDGYSEENSLSATADLSGNKNPIQAIGSAVTYLQRYTLNAALGLTASEDDDAQSTHSEAQRQEPPVEVVEPFELARAEGLEPDKSWNDWCNQLYAHVKAARTFQIIDQWIKLNADNLEALKHFNTGKFNKLRNMIQAVQDAKAKDAQP